MLDNEYFQPSKCKAKNCDEINDQSHLTYDTKGIKFKTSILK